MSRSVFGWDLPPGCSQRMIDDAFGGPDPTELQENVLTLLEKAKIPQNICDAIIELIADAEMNMHEPDPDYALEDKRDREMEE